MGLLHSTSYRVVDVTYQQNSVNTYWQYLFMDSIVLFLVLGVPSG